MPQHTISIGSGSCQGSVTVFDIELNCNETEYNYGGYNQTGQGGAILSGELFYDCDANKWIVTIWFRSGSSCSGLSCAFTQDSHDPNDPTGSYTCSSCSGSAMSLSVT